MFRNLMRCLSGNAVGSRNMSLIVKGETDTGRVVKGGEKLYQQGGAKLYH